MKLITLLSLPLLLSSTALAHDTKSPSNNSAVKGMNYIAITKSPPQKNTNIEGNNTKEAPPKDPSKETQDQIETALEKPLLEKKKQAEKEKREKEYFSSIDQLEKWPYLKDIISSSIENKASAIIELEKAPEKASPMILLLASEFYFKQNQKEKAALYFLASKLRAKFDMIRWSIVNDSGLEVRKKTHPAIETLSLSQNTPQNLSNWILSNKTRGQIILNNLKAWEEKTNYSYLPTYDINDIDFNFMDKDKLIEAHEEHLNNFIKEQNDILTLIHP